MLALNSRTNLPAGQLLALLLVLLLLQGGLIKMLHSGEERFAPVEVGAPLLDVKTDSVTRIQLSDGEHQRTLLKTDGVWYLDSGLPASRERAEQLLATLASVRVQVPVTRQASSHKRLHLADQDFFRKVTLTGEGDVSLLVGTSPGFRQSHVRLSDDPQVQIAPLDPFRLGLKASDWADPLLLSVANPVSLEMDGVQLFQRDGDWWLKQANAEPQPADTDRAVQAMAALQDLIVRGGFDNYDADVEAAQGFRTEPYLVVTTADDQRIAFHRRHVGTQYLLAREDVAHGHWFEVERDIWDSINTPLMALKVEEIEEPESDSLPSPFR
jgi:hypothetical protein